jgi:hypothetical protein
MEGRREVVVACTMLCHTALAAARLRSEQDIGAAKGSPINPAALDGAIRSYRDKTPGVRPDGQTWAAYRAAQRVTPLDVMHYAARVVNRLLVESRIRTEPTPGGYPTDSEKMRDRVQRLTDLVDSLPRE